MSQNDDIEKASRDFAEEASDSTEYASGSAEETETLQVAEDLERSQEASGHDFSRVAEGSEEVGALAPEGSLPPLSMGALSMGAPGPSLLGTGESPASNSASEPSIITYEYEPPARIPHLGHLALFVAFLLFGFLCATVLMLGAYFLHLGGVTTQEQIKTNVVYLLGFEAILYIFTIALSIPLFPLLWRKSFFAGVQWRGRTALHWSWLLALIAVGCFGLAMLDEVLLPGPEHAPIEELFRSPGAAWTMFIFGVTLAPFFEEMLFRAGYSLGLERRSFNASTAPPARRKRPSAMVASRHDRRRHSYESALRADSRRSAGPLAGAVSVAGHGQPDSVRGAAEAAVACCQHAGPLLLQLFDLFDDADWNGWLPAFGQDVTSSYQLSAFTDS